MRTSDTVFALALLLFLLGFSEASLCLAGLGALFYFSDRRRP